MNVVVQRREPVKTPITNVTVDFTPWEVREIVEAYQRSLNSLNKQTRPCRSNTLTELVRKLAKEIAGNDWINVIPREKR